MLSLDRLLKQTAQCGLKGSILSGCPFLRSLHSSTGSTVLPGVMPKQQSSTDIVCGIFPSVLMEYPGGPGQTHGCKAVVLGDHDISGCHPVDQGIVHTVSAFVTNQCFGPVTVKFVRGVTEDQAGDMAGFA